MRDIGIHHRNLAEYPESDEVIGMCRRVRRIVLQEVLGRTNRLLPFDTTEELLEAVFALRFYPELYKKDNFRHSVIG
jgi:hypothetical protein